MKSEQAPNFTLGLKRPAWVSSNVRQRSVVVGDGSPSMAGDKSRNAEEAIRELIEELAVPTNKDAFDVAVCRFDGVRAELLVPLTRASEAITQVASLRLCSGRDGTNMTFGLEEAERVIDQPQADPGKEVDPCVLVFSDGRHNTGLRPEPVADRLKSRGCTLVAVAYGRDADEELLRRLASSPQHFFRCEHGKDLRAFFAAVGATLSASVPRGIDPKQALTTIRQ